MSKRGPAFAALDVVETHLVVFALNRDIENIERHIRNARHKEIDGLDGALASARALRDRLKKRCDQYAQQRSK